MNFQDLLLKIKKLDEDDMGQSTGIMAPPSEPEIEECGDNPRMAPGMGNVPPTKLKSPGLQGGDEPLFGECGDDMQGGPQVSIRSLITALQAIEQGSSPSHDNHDGEITVLGMGEEQQDGGFGSATTEPDAELGDIDCVTKTGGDLASKGIEAPKVNGGGNAMREALVQRLSAHYQRVKEGN